MNLPPRICVRYRRCSSCVCIIFEIASSISFQGNALSSANIPMTDRYVRLHSLQLGWSFDECRCKTTFHVPFDVAMEECYAWIIGHEANGY